MNIDNTTIYRILNFGAKSWWAHQQLRDMGRHVQARREERRNILSDLETVRSALYSLVGHSHLVILTSPYSNVSGYGEMEHPLVLACVLRGVPCVEYSKLDRETAIILPRNCNLGCRYCDFAAPKLDGPVMSLDIARQAIDAYLNLLKAAGRNYGVSPHFIEVLPLIYTVKLIAVFAALRAIGLLSCTFQPKGDLVILDRHAGELELPDVQ